MSDHDPMADADVDDLRPPGAIGTETCATCDAPIDEYEWFPIRGRAAGDGKFHVYSFCDEGCLEAWDGPSE